MRFASLTCTRLHIPKWTVKACTSLSFEWIFVWSQYSCWPADSLRINHTDRDCSTKKRSSTTSDKNKRWKDRRTQWGVAFITSPVHISMHKYVCVLFCVLYLYALLNPRETQRVRMEDWSLFSYDPLSHIHAHIHTQDTLQVFLCSPATFLSYIQAS